MDWNEAADMTTKRMEGAVGAKTLTYDFKHLAEAQRSSKAPSSGTQSSSIWMIDPF
jgi:isocitrate dehydrogenase